MARKLLAVLVLVSLLVALLPGLGCGGGKEGELPSLKVGNKWTYKVVDQSVEYALAVEVTGEEVVDGNDCYLVTWTFTPAMQGMFSSMTTKYRKDTLQPVRMQTSGTYDGTPFTSVITSSYQFSGKLWPLEVGKETVIAETTTQTTTMQGETPDTNTETRTYTRRVEAIEDVTVAAGTFKCFKIVEYENAAQTGVDWYSDKAKLFVKTTTAEEDQWPMELKSYSI